MAKGFNLNCLACGEEQTTRVNLADVTVVACESCDAELTLDEIRDRLAGWNAAILWLDSAPELPE